MNDDFASARIVDPGRIEGGERHQRGALDMRARELVWLSHIDQHGVAPIQQFFSGSGVDLFDGAGHIGTLA